MYGPVIEGEKVRLRPHTEKDAHVFVQMLGNPEVTRYLQRQEPPSVRSELGWIADRATDPNSLSWTIEVDDKCVGTAGFDTIDWRNQVGSVGIFIGQPGLWNTGITTEVAELGVRFGFTALPLRKIKAGYWEPNVASAKAQARVGLREVGRHKAEYFCGGKWVDHVLTELHREDWVASALSR